MPMNAYLKQLCRRRDFLFSIYHRVEKEWNDGSAVEYLDRILKGEDDVPQAGVCFLPLSHLF